MTDTQVLKRTDHDGKAWRNLAELALRGLRNTYGRTGFLAPHTMRWDGRRAAPEGDNTRYVLISLLGLAKARGIVATDDRFTEFVDSLWARVAHKYAAIAQSPGDLGLGLWARSLHGGGNGLFAPDQALRVFRERGRACDSVDLAWLLLGADHALLSGADDGISRQLAEDAGQALLSLYNPNSRLFYRHGRGGPVAGFSRRIACFANQIYPVMALAVHARRAACEESARIGREAADNMCRLQGPLGQWWWLYDVKRGPVVDGYPVFSVHQDGMAPMALLETTAAGGRSYAHEIEKGLAWIFGQNELRRNLVQSDEGLVFRDIHRSGVGRAGRMIRGAAWCLGWSGNENPQPARGRLVVNCECRPYHLGWMLYAAGLVCAATARQSPCEPVESSAAQYRQNSNSAGAGRESASGSS